MNGASSVTGAVSAEAGQRSPLADQLATMERMPLHDLRSEWRRLVGAEPPRLSRDLLLRALAYRVQERAHGGLSRASLRQLKVDVAEGGSAITRASPALSLKPGARLVREWHGRSHVVIVMDAGFDYAGVSYRSLTEIARLITGAHWSGPRFFGLGGHRAASEAGDG